MGAAGIFSVAGFCLDGGREIKTKERAKRREFQSFAEKEKKDLKYSKSWWV